MVKQTPKLTLADAKTMIAAAEQHARDIGVDMDIAVVDDGGHLLMFQRMDDARVSSIDVAINKAFTAATARRSTQNYADMCQPGQPGFGMHASNQGRFMIVGGGLPLFWEGQIVGGIGCSSGSPAQDEAVAQTGVDALS